MTKAKCTVCLIISIALLLPSAVCAAADTGMILLAQPQSPVYPEGADAEYSVTAYSGGQEPSYHWYIVFEGKVYDLVGAYDYPWTTFLGGEILGAESDALTLCGVSEGLDGSSVYCEIFDGESTLRSSYARINVEKEAAAAPYVIVPVSLRCARGGEAAVKCLATPAESGETLEYRWYSSPDGTYDGMTLLEGEAFSGAELPCGDTEAGTAWYVCEVIASGGGRTFSSPVKIEVFEPGEVPAPAIVTASLPKGRVGAEYSAILICDDVNATFAVTDDGESAAILEQCGLKLTPAWAITGTPVSEGTFEFSLSAVGEGGETSKTFRIVVEAAEEPSEEPSEKPSEEPSEEDASLPEEESKPEDQPSEEESAPGEESVAVEESLPGDESSAEEESVPESGSREESAAPVAVKRTNAANVITAIICGLLFAGAVAFCAILIIKNR